jgi:hypothetical protein
MADPSKCLGGGNFAAIATLTDIEDRFADLTRRTVSL